MSVPNCFHDSLLLQLHPVCETLRRALSYCGCPILGNYTHLISTCETAGARQPNNVAEQRGQDRLRSFSSSFHHVLFYILCEERGQTCV